MSLAKAYDCLVLGGGPAGLSVAQGLSRVHRTCALFSDSKFRNEGIHASHNVVTRDGIHPAEFRDIAREQISSYHMTDFIDTRITKVVNTSCDGKMNFEVSDSEDQRWRGRALVFATGCKDIFPDIQGYKENWPHNIYQCLFCDGHERSHLPKGILTLPSTMYLKLASMAKYQSLNNSTVTIFTDGHASEDPTIQKGLEASKALGLIIEERKIKCLEATGDVGVNVVFEDGEKIYQGFLVHKPVTTLVAEDLINELGIETEQNAMAKIVKRNEPWGMTNVKGVFVAGDAGTFLTAVTVAMAQGATAASAITHLLLEEDDETALERYQEISILTPGAGPYATGRFDVAT